MEQFKISRALGLSFKSLFRSFIPFVVLAALLYSPIVIWLATNKLESARELDLLNQLFVYPVYLMVAVSTLIPPLLTYRIVKELDGAVVPLVTSIKFGLRGVLPALFLAVLTHLAQRVPGIGGIIGAVLTCIYFVVAPAAVAEKLNPFAAFSRSAALTQGRRWGIFGLTFLIGLVAVGLMFIWIIPMFGYGSHETASSLRTSSIALVIILGMLQMFTGVAQAVSYALLRQDKDGVSHAELARVFE